MSESRSMTKKAPPPKSLATGQENNRLESFTARPVCPPMTFRKGDPIINKEEKMALGVSTNGGPSRENAAVGVNVDLSSLITDMQEMKRKVKELEKDTAEKMEEMKTEHATTMEEMKTEHATAMEEMKTEHATTMEEMKTEHATAMEEMEARLLTQIQTHETEIANIQAQLDNSRSQARETEEVIETESESLYQSVYRLNDSVDDIGDNRYFQRLLESIRELFRRFASSDRRFAATSVRQDARRTGGGRTVAASDRQEDAPPADEEQVAGALEHRDASQAEEQDAPPLGEEQVLAAALERQDASQGEAQEAPPADEVQLAAALDRQDPPPADQAQAEAALDRRDLPPVAPPSIEFRFERFR